MEQSAKETSKDGLERAFSICKKDQHVRITPQCTGSTCTTEVPGCPVGFEELGYYHTHPPGLEDFSVADHHYTLVKKIGTQCVGTVVKVEDSELGLEYPEFRVQCASYNKQHPLYEQNRQKIMELSSTLYEIEVEVGKMVYEDKKAVPAETMDAYHVEKEMFEQRLEQARKAGVFIQPWGTQGIDEFFGVVKRKLIEDAKEIK